MVDDGVAFLLVVIEEEPYSAVVVVSGGNIADMTVTLCIVHDAVVLTYKF